MNRPSIRMKREEINRFLMEEMPFKLSPQLSSTRRLCCKTIITFEIFGSGPCQNSSRPKFVSGCECFSTFTVVLFSEIYDFVSHLVFDSRI